MLLGLTDISDGQARVLGHDPVREPLAVKRQVGYLPDQVGFYDNLTAAENPRYTARLMGSIAPSASSDPIPARACRARRRDRQARGDVLARHAPAARACRDPDEGGADRDPRRADVGARPAGHAELLNIIRDLKHRGVSVLLSSHLLERVQSVCDRVALFSQGNIVLIGTVPELGRRCSAAASASRWKPKGRGSPSASRDRATGRGRGANRFLLHADHDVRPEAAAAVVAAGGRLLRLSVEEPSLEAIYRATSRPTKESVMRREGSALHGFGVVTLKEIADHFSSILVVVLVVLVTASAIVVAVSLGIDPIKESTAEDPFLFLRLFTRSTPFLWSLCCRSWCRWSPSGSALTLSTASTTGTRSRILSQPIYRDALLFGKFAAGLFTLAVALIVLWLLVIGLGLLGLGIPPNAEEMARALVLLVVTMLMPASGSRSRSCARSCSAPPRRPRWSRSGYGCS